MTAFITTLAALSLACVAHAVRAQDVEPGVQTSSAAAPTAKPASASSSTAASTPSTKAGAIDGKTPAAGAKAPAATAGAAPKGAKASDRIELDTTQISGNRELPKVMYVVPWRKADPGEFTGRPLNSLLDEALTPVDRDVFRRQNRYYAGLQAEPGSDKSQPASPADGSASPTPKDEK
jgi:hypothetical protein